MRSGPPRRAILAGVTALFPALAIPSVASAAPDPIFCAMERHSRARSAYWTSPPGETDEESDARLKRTGPAADDTLDEFLRTKPATLAGCIAALRHVQHHLVEYEEGEQSLMSNCTEPLSSAGSEFLTMIADALAALAVQS